MPPTCSCSPRSRRRSGSSSSRRWPADCRCSPPTRTDRPRSLPRRTGWLVPADDQPALTETLLSAASDPQERRRRGERAHKHARSGYGWPVIAAQIADLYDEVSGGLDAQRAALA